MLGVTAYANETAATYMLSNSDVNRIVAPAPIKEVHTSDEKALQIKISGDSLYVKFPVIMTDDNGLVTKTLATEPVGVFIDTGADVYNLLLYPTDNPPQTIALKSSSTDEVEELEIKGKAIEDVLSELIRIVTQDKMPAGVVPIDHNKASQIARGHYAITALLRKEMNIYSFKVLEVYLYSPVETSIIDAELLKLPWISTPMATAVLDSTFKGWTRAVVIQKGGEDVR
jgi:hypothetical protein